MGRSGDTQAGWQAALRERGYRLTPQRQLVLEAVADIGHATPEAIAAAVRRTASGVNKSTVYRTLELLEELGLVRHSHLGHGAPTYSVAGEDDHIHLVCRACEGVLEVPAALVRGVASRLAKDHGFVVDVGHSALFGTCRECHTDLSG